MMPEVAPALHFARPVALLLILIAIPVFLIQLHSLRGLPVARRRAVLAIRLAVLSLLVASLSEPSMATAPNSTAVAFLLDVSDSVSAEQQQVNLAWVRQALRAKRPADLSEVIAFAGEPVIQQPLSGGIEVAEARFPPDTSQTNLATAIRLAVSTLPRDKAQSIVVLSDGAENSGNALQEAKLAAGASVPISFVSPTIRKDPEMLVRAVETPAVMREEDVFEVRVSVQSNIAGSANLYLSIDGAMDSAHQVVVKEGLNNFTISHAPLAKGFHSFQVTVEPPEDTLVENNVGASYSSVAGKAKVLLVEGRSGAARQLANALAAGGLEPEVREAAGLPASAGALRDFDSVVLVNVPASQLGSAQQDAIKTYVRSLGGGLVTVGGDQAYGMGGYARTALADVLPVSTEVRGRSIQSSVALVLVIDRSGSMSDGPAGARKIDLAKKAATESVALLGQQDQVGVVSFDDGWKWVVEPTFLDSPDTVSQRIGTLAPGGGTDIFPALQEAYRAMSERTARIRHIILMTDGLSPGGDFAGLMAGMRKDDITLSTIAIGTDSDMALLKRLADAGNGRYYEGIDPFDVPQLAVKETMEIARTAIVEHEAQPVASSGGALLEGIGLSGMPTLLGYVATTLKPSSTAILSMGDEQDPLLAEWQYGLGQVVAWTSDAESRWATNWIGWPRFVQFWSQVVKRTIPSQIERNMQVSIQQRDGEAAITVDTRDDAGNNVNLLQSTAIVVDPGGRTESIGLRQSAPGRYEGSFVVAERGVYSVNVRQTRSGEAAPFSSAVAGYAVAYSPEYRVLDDHSSLLPKIALVSRGTALDNPAGAFRYSRAVSPARSPLWPPLVAMALLLFICDIAARRLRAGPKDIRRGLRHLSALWKARGAPAARPATARLVSVKQRVAASRAGLVPLVKISTTITRTSSDEPSAARVAGGGARTAVMSARLIEAKRRAGREKN